MKKGIEMGKRLNDVSRKASLPCVKPLPVIRPYRVVIQMTDTGAMREELMFCHPTVFYSKLEMQLRSLGYSKQAAATAYVKISEELIGG